MFLKERLALKSSDVVDVASVDKAVEKSRCRADAGADDSEDVKETFVTEFKERGDARARDRDRGQEDRDEEELVEIKMPRSIRQTVFDRPIGFVPTPT